MTKEEVFILVSNEMDAAVLKLAQNVEASGKNDDDVSLNDWLAFASAYLGRAAEGVYRNTDNSVEMRIKAIGLLFKSIMHGK